MELGQKIERIIPYLGNKLPPLKARSFEHFLGLIEKHNIRDIWIEPVTKQIGYKGGPTTIGYIGTYENYTLYAARTRRGRRMMYKEPQGERFGSQYGFTDSEDRSRAKLQGDIAAETRLRQIQERVPDIRLSGPIAEMDFLRREEMWKKARRDNIKPFPKQNE